MYFDIVNVLECTLKLYFKYNNGTRYSVQTTIFVMYLYLHSSPPYDLNKYIKESTLVLEYSDMRT